mmetsp:Transcript_105175/g.234790  ORF Transcript_105175/g.234790 Transcript_105175/m.234790 type:complete len:235 (-) Transcript_105175:224-928(-)
MPLLGGSVNYRSLTNPLKPTCLGDCRWLCLYIESFGVSSTNSASAELPMTGPCGAPPAHLSGTLGIEGCAQAIPPCTAHARSACTGGAQCPRRAHSQKGRHGTPHLLRHPHHRECSHTSTSRSGARTSTSPPPLWCTPQHVQRARRSRLTLAQGQHHLRLVAQGRLGWPPPALGPPAQPAPASRMPARQDSVLAGRDHFRDLLPPTRRPEASPQKVRLVLAAPPRLHQLRPRGR